jgi:hypothetical protein
VVVLAAVAAAVVVAVVVAVEDRGRGSITPEEDEAMGCDAAWTRWTSTSAVRSIDGEVDDAISICAFDIPTPTLTPTATPTPTSTPTPKERPRPVSRSTLTDNTDVSVSPTMMFMVRCPNLGE